MVKRPASLFPVRLHMPRIFICDDDPHYRVLLHAVLSSQYEIVGEARDGQECIELVAAAKPDVVLLDINMPRRTGMEALPQIREQVPGAKVVALSTGTAAEYEEEFLGGGGYAFVEKPHDVLALADHLRLLLEGEAGSALQLVEELVRLHESGQSERVYALYAPDVEFTPTIADSPTLRGIDAIRAFVETLPPGLRDTKTEVAQILARGNQVAVLGLASMVEGGRAVQYPLGSVIRVENGRIRSIHNFRDWNQAREAAGLGEGVEPEAKRTFRTRLLEAVAGRMPPAGPAPRLA